MAFLNLDIEQIIKEKMGDFYPKDLVWEIEEQKICFYNAKTPDLSSCFGNSELSQDDLDQIVSVIIHCHKKEWIKSNEEKIPIDNCELIIDYRDLLKRYIAHVEESEGINFIARCLTEKSKYHEIVFSKEEVKELYNLESEYKSANH